MSENAVLMFRPLIQVRGERVAEVLSIPIEQANRLLSQPETKQIVQTALEQSFQRTVDTVLEGMSRVPMEAVPTRVDCFASVTGVEMSAAFEG